MKTICKTIVLLSILPISAMSQVRIFENSPYFKHSMCNQSGAVEGNGTAAARPKYQSELKAQTILKHSLDSIIVTGNWKDLYTYNDLGLLTKMTALSWDSTSSKWINKSTNEYSYNSSNLQKDYTFKQWNAQSNEYILGWKGDYTYNDKGSVTEVVDMKWDTIAKVWRNEWQKLYEYDNNQNMTYSAVLLWDSIQKVWKNSWKEEYTFDANGRELTYSVSKWNTASSIWESVWESDLKYDNNGNALSYVGFQSNSTDGQLWSGWKEDRIYDANNNMTQYEGYTYDVNFKEWKKKWKETYTYDAYNNKIRTDGYSYNATNDSWDKSQKINYTHDPLISADIIVMPYWNEGLWNTQIKQSVEYGYYSVDGTWVEKSRTMYYYSSRTYTNAFESRNISQQPLIYLHNSRTLLVSAGAGDLLEVVNASGLRVLQTSMNGNTDISLGHLKHGTYTALLRSLDKSIVAESFIVE